jgi:amino acid permease
VSGGSAAAASKKARVRKLAGITFFLYCGFAFFFVVGWAIGSTEFDLPIGPPIFAVVSVTLACIAVTRLARRSRP